MAMTRRARERRSRCEDKLQGQRAVVQQVSELKVTLGGCLRPFLQTDT